MHRPFDGFDFSDFWKPSAYADEWYVDSYPTDTDVKLIEKKIGYKLPLAYVALARNQNGGIPNNPCHPVAHPTCCAEDHIRITGIYAIGERKPYSLCGEVNLEFWMSEWGYPPLGVYFADCPSGGHDMLCLDYSECGPQGEPRVVHVDQENNYRVTFVAPDFESFIRGLESVQRFESTDLG